MKKTISLILLVLLTLNVLMMAGCSSKSKTELNLSNYETYLSAKYEGSFENYKQRSAAETIDVNATVEGVNNNFQYIDVKVTFRLTLECNGQKESKDLVVTCNAGGNGSLNKSFTQDDFSIDTGDYLFIVDEDEWQSTFDIVVADVSGYVEVIH